MKLVATVSLFEKFSKVTVYSINVTVLKFMKIKSECERIGITHFTVLDVVAYMIIVAFKLINVKKPL